MRKWSKLYSIFSCKCPKCHEGDFFKYPFTFNPSKITQLHSHCAKCGFKFMIEPSFFYGAMYVNYALTTALSIVVFIISKVILASSLLQSFTAILISLVILAPFNLRFSRIIWINMFVSYDKNAIKNYTTIKNEK